jgi:hypothetical protein
MISLVELAVRVGGLKANGLPATNFEHHFVPTFVNTGKELVLFEERGAWPPLAPSRGLGCYSCALSMMQRLSNVMRGGQRLLKAQAQGLSNSGSSGTERHSGRCDRDFPLASRQTTSLSILTAPAPRRSDHRRPKGALEDLLGTG